MKALFLLVLLLPLFPCAAQSTQDSIRGTFNDYKSAILNDDGERAVGYVDSRTLAYYGEMLDKTKTADSSTVDALPIMDKLMVLAIRHRTSRADLLRFDAQKLFVYAIEQGMVGKGSVMNIEIGEVTVDGATARGQFMSNGVPGPVYFGFYDENGWKVDLTSIFPAANEAFQQMVDESTTNENEYLIQILEMLTGTPASEDIWQPVTVD